MAKKPQESKGKKKKGLGYLKIHQKSLSLHVLFQSTKFPIELYLLSLTEKKKSDVKSSGIADVCQMGHWTI